MRRATALALTCAAALGVCAPAQAMVTRAGTLEAIVTDNFRTSESNTRYSVDSGKGETPVRPTALAAEPGDRVTVTGELRDGRLVGEVEATSASAQPPATAAPREVAVLLVSFPGEAEEPWSAAVTRSKVFTAADSASAFYEEESHGGISLSGKLDEDGDVFGWLALDTPTAECPFLTWRDEANAAAAAEGIDLAGYDHVIYVFPPQSSCSWLGLAVIGGDWSMINGNLGVHAISHELGHNLGLDHAGSLTCFSGSVRVQISNACALTEYGDPFDTMGNIAPRHSNGWNLEKLGVLAPANVETVEESGTYSLRSALQPSAQPTMLRFPRLVGDSGDVLSWYFLEVRETGGIFENVVDASTAAVSVRATRDALLTPAETLLLDANPGTASFADAPLGAGQTFDGGAVTIRTLSAGGGAATVSVELDEEPPTVPAGLTATVGVDGVRLQWGPSTDNYLLNRYLIFRDGALIGSTDETGFLDPRVAAGDHTYVVRAEDTVRNLSAASTPAAVTVPIVSGPECAAGGCRVTHRYSGAAATWTVPPGVETARFTVEGARGGGFGFNMGARVEATIGSLTAGEAATVSVGGAGEPYSDGGEGGFGGGGDGTRGAGGGGFSSVALDSTPMLLAGGGGGKGLGPNGTDEEGIVGAGGHGGLAATAGRAGRALEAQGATLGGGAGGASGGSGGGASGSGGQVTGTSACAGGAQAGASGAAGSSLAGGGGAPGAGGGGGGGYVGGGQGGGGAADGCGGTAGAGGGGGGSSFAAAGLSAEFAGGVRDGDGQIFIAYANPIAAAGRAYVTRPGEALVVPAASGVLSGASGPGGVPLSASLVEPPAHGSLALAGDGSFTYLPGPGHSGHDSFAFRVADGSGNYATARATLTVAGPPSALILGPPAGGTYVLGQAVSTAFACGEGAGGTGLLSCADSTGAIALSGGVGRLDTSTLGSRTYAVTATSKTGLTGSASIAYTVVPPPEPPEAPSPPPSDPAPPPRGVGLSLGVERRSLRALLRSGRLTVTTRVSAAATVALTGAAEIEPRGRRRTRTRLVALFEPKTIRFAGAGERTVALRLSRSGRAALRGLRSARLVLLGRATDRAREVAAKKLELTLR
jgi:Bacterial Ig domain/Gametolysin peptidase M11